MREILLSDSSKATVRGLRRKEIRECSQFGFGYSICNIPPESFDAACDQILATQFADEFIDTLENIDQLRLFGGIIKETYGSLGEEKNSPGSGTGGPTIPEPNAAGSVDNGQNY